MSQRRAAIGLAVIHALTPGDVVLDTVVKGFGVRRQAHAVTYFVRTRVHGKQRWITFGHHGQASPDGQAWTPTNARKHALKLLADPAIADRVADPATVTFPQAASLFLERHGPTLKPRTQVEYERLVRLYLLRAFDRLSLATITRAHVSAAHLRWSKEAPRSANAAVTVLSKLMTWAKDEGLRDGENPCTRVKRNKEPQRRRYLSLPELTRLGAALDDAEVNGPLSPYAIAAIRLLILTGARYSEILTLEWSFVDFERGLVFLPDSKTGQKVVTLNESAIAVFQSIPRLASNPYVIVGKDDGTHMANIHHAWAKISSAAGITDVRLHDLRHTWASTAVAAGVSLPIIGRQLGHMTPRTTARYAHLADDPVRQATEVIGARLAEAMRQQSKPSVT